MFSQFIFRIFLVLSCLSSFLMAEKEIFFGILVKNFDQLFPYFLKTIDQLDYSKNNIHLQFDICNDNPEIKNILSNWVKENNQYYKKIAFIDHAYTFPMKGDQKDKNSFFAEIKDGYLKETSKNKCDYCFILSSDTFLLPHSLKHLVAKEKQVIAPLLRAIPEAKDPFRNFFADVSESGYYKHHDDYYPIANRNKLGTYKVPCISYAYLIQADVCDTLNFTKNFVDWEFLSFSRNARESSIDQYICNEREFGSFLHFSKEMSLEAEKAFTLAGMEYEITPNVLDELIVRHYANDPHLKEYAKKFNFKEYAIYRIDNQDLFYVDEVNDYIKNFVLKQGSRFEEYIHDQFKKHVKPGTTVLDIGGHIGIHTLNLSRLVGKNGKVHVFEPQAKMFCELAINMHLNQCKNVVLHHNALGSTEKWIEMFIPEEEWTERFGETVVNEGHGTVNDSSEKLTGDKAKMIPLDSLHLDDISFIKIDVEGFEMEVIRGGIETIKRNKPVMIVEIFQNSDLVKKIKEIEDLGYTHLPLNVDNYLFLPTKGAKISQKTPLNVSDAINVAWEGSYFDLGSLSNVNRSLVKELSKISDILISCIPCAFPSSMGKVTGLENLLPLVKPVAPENTSITVRHAWPPSWSPPTSGKWVLIQPWEFGAVPADWVEQITKVDEVWVPSNFVKNEFVYSGVPSEKVKVMPNGIDPSIFHPGAPSYPLPTNKKFKFLFVGGTIFRKGADILLNSYEKVFTDKDDVCLVIKDFGANGHYAGQTMGDRIKAVPKKPNSPEIIYLEDEMTADEIASLYKACDCLVYPYRGEGFALPVLEAMACGLPVIVTAGGATSDFVTNDCGWFIPSTTQSIGRQVGTIKLAKDGWLLEPNNDALSAILTWLPKHPDRVRSKGLAAQTQAKEWTWEKAAAITANRLRELSIR